MGRFGKAISSPRFNIVLFVIAAALLLGSIVGGTQAAMSYSDSYQARIQSSCIGVTLVENDEDVAYRNYLPTGRWDYLTNPDGTPSDPEATAQLLNDLPANGESLKIGYRYPEELKVRNTGRIAQYVRVTLVKHWEDQEGNKDTTLTPDLIDLNLTNTTQTGEANPWLYDREDSTAERTVLYYNVALNPGEETVPLSDVISVSPEVVRIVTQTQSEPTINDDGTTITTTYDYDGKRLCLEASVYAVQQHNILDAFASVWGKNVTIRNGVLSLRNQG